MEEFRINKRGEKNIKIEATTVGHVNSENFLFRGADDERRGLSSRLYCVSFFSSEKIV